MSVAFVDVETTGLNPHFHEVWEIGLIVDEVEYEWQLAVDLRKADPAALRVGRFYERRGSVDDPTLVARAIAGLTANRHLAGMNPAFDAAFLSKFLHVNGYKDAWEYHLIDCEALMIGYLRGKGSIVIPPWNSSDLSSEIGVAAAAFDRHTALGDAQWAKAVYERVMG